MPPLTRYQTKTFTKRLSPKVAEMYEIWIRLGPEGESVAPTAGRNVMSFFSLAVWAAVYPKNKLFKNRQ